jgi:hypothetical protein
MWMAVKGAGRRGWLRYDGFGFIFLGIYFYLPMWDGMIYGRKGRRS